MGMPRRYRAQSPGKENLRLNRESRPWDNDIARLKPPAPHLPSVSVSDRMRLFEAPSPPGSPHNRDSNPLDAFLTPDKYQQTPQALPPPPPPPPRAFGSEAASPPLSPRLNTPIKTRLGNRDLHPPVAPPNPPPLVGLPIPPAPPQKPPLPDIIAPGLPAFNLPPSPPRDPSPHRESSTRHRRKHSQSDNPHNSLSVPPSQPQPIPHTPTPPSALPTSQPLEPHPLDMPSSQLEPPRFSNPRSTRPTSRHSMRHSVRNSVRHSVRVSGAPGMAPPADLGLLQSSSSFLDFNDDHRLGNAPQVPPQVLDDEDDDALFDDPDSFDTFSSLPRTEPRAEQSVSNITNVGTTDNMSRATGPSNQQSEQSDKPMFPSMSFTENAAPRKSVSGDALAVGTAGAGGSSNDDDDGGLDVPKSIGASPAADRALRDLQRASITAANDLANSMRFMSQSAPTAEKHTTTTVGNVPGGATNGGGKRQGQLLLRSRLFRRWNTRYASVIQQAFFGPVLLLFRPESSTRQVFSPAFALKSSKMIALTHATVTINSSTKGLRNQNMLMFDLTTSQRTYTFACPDESSRAFWMSSLSAPPL